ncbi:CHAT domain-containing protein [Aporhodopirellula aestuarii]|uniref:CHAT domain-containing protein n=1 Tax=Aporhodopirellula aestuarii TaxID=2950107 RepID=A0ABT0U6I0_9BACT|nr:CHAT domain-containing protein [Aporhodopirellula aestuarii]MCM2372279.1 CHAT domain-containing protein [Aporhodopirellula aestuarii]
MTLHTKLLAFLTVLTISLMGDVRVSAQVIGRTGTDPMQTYYEAMRYYRDGDIQNAIRGFEFAARGTRMDINGKWVDAIPPRVMLAECYWQLGHLPACRLQLDEAARIAIRNRGWLGQLDFSGINLAGQIKQATNNLWPEVAAVRLLPLPTSIPIQRGQAVTEQSLAAGGVIETPNIQSIDAITIMQSIAKLMHRRRVLLGPLGPDDTLSREVLEATKMPSSINHPLGQSLVHAMRGCEYYAIGEDKTVVDRASKYASPGGAHPITPILMLSAMKVATAGDDTGKLSPEARALMISTAAQITNVSAALDQYEWIGEALQIAVGVADPATLARVEQTAVLAGRSLVRQSRLASLHCYLIAADAAVSAGRNDVAAEYLQSARTLATRRDVELPRLQAYGAYIAARLAARSGQPIGASGAGDMASALKSVADFVLDRRDQRRPVISMPFMYQADIVMASLGGNIGNQSAKRMLAGYSGTVGIALWRQDPLNALAATYYDDSAMHAALMRMALMENDGPGVLRQSDRVLAKRLTSRLPLQGRMLQLRTLATSPADSLWPSAREILADPSPAFTRLREKTQASLIVPPPGDNVSVRSESLAIAMEAELSDLTLSRIHVPELNPPAVAATDVAEVPDGVCLLTFVIDSGKIVATATRDGNTRAWVIPAATRLIPMVNRLLQDIGASRVRGKRLPDSDKDWKEAAYKLRSFLLPESSGWSEEGLEKIIVVPDGALWYLPFELLPSLAIHEPKANENGATELSSSMWGDDVRVEYAPTPGFALRNAGAATTADRIGMVAGTFFALRDLDANEAMLNDVLLPADNPFVTTPAKAPPTQTIGLEIGHMIVAAPLTPNLADPLSTHVIPLDNSAGRAAGRGDWDTLRDWIRFPASGPKSVVIAGLRTSAETTKLGDGGELFFPMAALRASGVREVGLCRWPTGGASSATVLTEIVNEIPHTSLAAALRRGSTMLRQAELSTSREPLLGKPDTDTPAVSGNEPLFWATYLGAGSLDLEPPLSDD